MPGDIQKVRPLGDSDATAAKEPPRLLLVAVVLLIGVLVGWGFSASRDEPTATRETGTTETASPQTLTDVPDPEPVPEGIEVDWQEATEVPPIPDGYEYGGTSGPVTLDGAFYLMVRFRDVENGSLRNELWISDDAVSWRSEVLDLGEQAEVIGLAATNDDLVITANGANGFFMWTSTAGVSGDRSSWEPVDLQLPEGFDVLYNATVTNRAGEVITTVIAESNIWREVVAPYVPEDIDLLDPAVFFSSTSLHFDGTSLAVFDEAPQVVMTDDSVWVRIVTLDGEEMLQTFDLPQGAYLVETATDLGSIPVTFSWFSTDGTGFLPVLGRSALPDGYFLPEPWGDGFIAASYTMTNSFEQFETVRLWQTSSGRAWRPIDSQPPSECTTYFSASTGERMLLTNYGNGHQCVLARDGEWQVLEEDGIARYLTAGPGGFIAYPDGFEYDTTRFSPDGETWTALRIPAAEPYPTLLPLEEGLFMLSVDPGRPGIPKQIELWLGTIELSPRS